ncbi:MAG: PhnD/SsuA/transferrin family substrate-binding protein [Defluviitaleaceae bacterium]|nr:PhnD/SsuA/transferrin family substrate-binding protein [Defluviitaleaceae bacterium]
MKKFIHLLLLLLTLILTSCSPTPPPHDPSADTPPIRIVAMRGPTAMGLLQLMDAQNNGAARNNYEFELLGSPDLVAPLLLQGNADVAVVPANLAAVLYSRMDVQALAVVTLGNLHILATDEINSVADLAGKTVYLYGQGITPEIALNYVLTQNGLVPGEDVTLEFRAEHTEVAALLESGQAQVALLPEPFASTVLARELGLNAVLDLGEEWARVSEHDLIMSVVIARREFLENNAALVEIMLEEYQSSVSFVNSDVSAGAELAVDFGLIPSAAVAEASIPRSNIVFFTGEEMRRNLLGFYQVLYDSEPALVGGDMPDQNFFFSN